MGSELTCKVEVCKYNYTFRVVTKAVEDKAMTAAALIGGTMGLGLPLMLFDSNPFKHVDIVETSIELAQKKEAGCVTPADAVVDVLWNGDVVGRNMPMTDSYLKLLYKGPGVYAITLTTRDIGISDSVDVLVEQ